MKYKHESQTNNCTDHPVSYLHKGVLKACYYLSKCTFIMICMNNKHRNIEFKTIIKNIQFSYRVLRMEFHDHLISFNLTIFISECFVDQRERNKMYISLLLVYNKIITFLYVSETCHGNSLRNIC